MTGESEAAIFAGGVLETHMLECILPLSEIQGNEKESSISYASAQGEEPS